MHLITAYIRIIHDHSFEDIYNYLKWLEAETKNKDGSIFFSIYPADREKSECIPGENGKIKRLLMLTLKYHTLIN